MLIAKCPSCPSSTIVTSRPLVLNFQPTKSFFMLPSRHFSTCKIHACLKWPLISDFSASLSSVSTSCLVSPPHFRISWPDVVCLPERSWPMKTTLTLAFCFGGIFLLLYLLLVGMFFFLKAKFAFTKQTNKQYTYNSHRQSFPSRSNPTRAQLSPIFFLIYIFFYNFVFLFIFYYYCFP